MIKQTLQLIRKWYWVLLLLGSSIFFALGGLRVGLPPAFSTLFTPLVSTDINQHRLDTALPLPQGNFTIEQSFIPRWDGLSEISLLIARAPSVTTNGRFTLTLLNNGGSPLHETSYETADFEHNQELTFRFPTQQRSAGNPYILQISGDASNPLTVWGYSLNVYEAGEMALVGSPLSDENLPETAVSTLRFTTHNRLTLTDAAISLGTMLWRNGAPMLLLLLFVPLPGLLILLAGPKQWRQWEGIVQYALALALGLAIWPMLWYFLTLLGGRWRGWSLWGMFVVGYAVVGWLWWRNRGLPSQILTEWRGWGLDYGLLLLLIGGYIVRLLAVRDVAAPLWVDASRHALITAVMANSGQTVTDYAPFLPEVTRFPYHFGFHTLSASLKMMGGWGLPPLLLHMGQLLNALVPLTIYAALRLLRQRRVAALFGAFMVAFPLFFPAYYTSWGRLTQLTAVLLLPLLVAFSWRLCATPRPCWRRLEWLLVGLLAAGLLLVHFRVFLYYMPLMGLIWLVNKGRNLLQLAAAVGLALLLTGARLVQLTLTSDPVAAVQVIIPNYNEFPVRFVQLGWETQILLAAGVAWLLIVLSGILGKRWALLPLTVAGWVGMLFILLAGSRLGLPETGLVNTNSMYIMMFVPLALFLGIAFGRGWRLLRHAHWILQTVGFVVIGFFLAALLLFGARQQMTIINPRTTLVYPADLTALAWVEENVSETAVFAVSSWNWLGGTWAGADGGAWLVPLTRRGATTPPADYGYSPDLFLSVDAFNAEAAGIEDWSQSKTADFLRQNDVTHLFIGVQGGYLRPEQLINNPKLELLYQQNGTFIFKLK